MAERVIQSGNLGDLPMVDLVMAARNAQYPAILRLSRGGVQRAFWFRDGRLAAVTTDGKAESLATMLVKRGKLDVTSAPQ